MTGTGRRGPYRGTATKRAQIVDAALEEFAAGGYDAASLRSIATTAGTGHTTVLHHFRTKEELLIAVLNQHEARERESLSLLPPPTTVGDLAENLAVAVAQDQLRPALIRLRAGLSATANRPEHPAHDFAVRRYERYVAELTDQFSAIRSAGALPDGVQPRAAAVAVLAVIEGLLMHWLAVPALDVPAGIRRAVPLLAVPEATSATYVDEPPAAKSRGSVGVRTGQPE